jgi:hypothetical protein
MIGNKYGRVIVMMRHALLHLSVAGLVSVLIIIACYALYWTCEP